MLGQVPWVESVHPSPLSACRGFFGSKPFSRVNRMLEEQGAAAGGLAPAGRSDRPADHDPRVPASWDHRPC